MVVTIVILSDILLFLQENNQKYYFVTPENKPSVLPVKSLLARDKPGGTTKSMMIMSTASTKDPGSLGDLEVFDVEIQQPPTREDWIAGIRNAVDSYIPGSESETEVAESSMTRKCLDEKHLKMRRLTASLKAKDLEMAKLLDEKMKIMRDIVHVVSEGEENVLVNLPKTDYLKLVNSGADEGSFTKEHLLAALQEASKLAVSLNSGTLSRSASSVGERHSQDFSAPLLPKRAETFSEFDQSTVHAPSKKLVVQEINLMSGETDEAEFISRSADTKLQHVSTANDPQLSSQANTTLTALNLNHTSSPLQSLDPEEQKTAYEMTHQLNRLMCMVSTHLTNMESVKAELSEIKEKSRVSGGRYVQNQQLEELRNLQDHLAREKRAWQVEREEREKENEIKKAELQKAQEEIDRHKKDIKEQREQLFRKLEVLRKYQGIELGPNMAILKSDPSAGIISHQHVDPKFDGSGSDIPDKPGPGRQSASGGLTTPNVGVRKASSMSGGTGTQMLVHANTMATGGSLKKDSFTNQNLMSATNETKQSVVGVEKHEIRQQIPVKLSSKLSVSTRGSASQSTSALTALGAGPVLTDIKSSKKSTISNTSTVSTSALPQAVQFPKPDGMQQLLPFKLSESQHAVLTQQQTSPGKHRQPNSSYYGEPQGVNRFQQPSLGHQDSAQQRQLRGLQSVPVQDQQQYQKTNSNTLPKKSPSEKAPTAGVVGSETQSGDDVIYFF